MRENGKSDLLTSINSIMEAKTKVREKEPFGFRRLESRNVRNAIIQKIAQDFNLTPIIAEAYFSRISSYFQEQLRVDLHSGQIPYEAISAYEPTSKHIALSKKVTTKPALLDLVSHFQALADSGLAALRRHRLLRLTREAVGRYIRDEESIEPKAPPTDLITSCYTMHGER